jgi:hypothetical protein
MVEKRVVLLLKVIAPECTSSHWIIQRQAVAVKKIPK